ncbi:hypothetical protein BAE44_0002310 [Dichanthelium oligosanthes]|uniref:Uncharacterized protein n=1 Tax=Dichanthelium oligosanthes TaxID=888268 RepID=A0A1E5WH51_9POAL|nr:hypothetical protein BAE44_0002310 [Dichanthelium oligosanthes]
MAGAAAPKDWRLVSAHAVHLGAGKFCIARFYDVPARPRVSEENFVVFAGVEVVSSGDGRELRIVKHRSER